MLIKYLGALGMVSAFFLYILLFVLMGRVIGDDPAMLLCVGVMIFIVIPVILWRLDKLGD